MMRVITDPDGSKVVILTGRSAEAVIANAIRNPPPFPVVNFRPASAYDPETRTTEPLFDPGEGAIFDRLSREVAHYRGLEASKDTMYAEAVKENGRLREYIEKAAAERLYEAEQAAVTIEQLRSELDALRATVAAPKVRKLAAKAKVKAALPSTNGKHPKK